MHNMRYNNMLNTVIVNIFSRTILQIALNNNNPSFNKNAKPNRIKLPVLHELADNK